MNVLVVFIKSISITLRYGPPGGSRFGENSLDYTPPSAPHAIAQKDIARKDMPEGKGGSWLAAAPIRACDPPAWPYGSLSTSSSAPVRLAHRGGGRREKARFDGSLDRAAVFHQVAAIAEAALGRQGRDLREGGIQAILAGPQLQLAHASKKERRG